MDIEIALEEMQSPHVLEATLITFPKILNVADPDDAHRRVLALSELPATRWQELHELIRRASEEVPDEAVELMRASIVAACLQRDVTHESMQQTIDAVGRKQLVITPELYHLALLLAVGYVAYLTKGRTSSTEKIVMKEDKNGVKTVTIEKKNVYLNPFSPLVKLVELLTTSKTNSEE